MSNANFSEKFSDSTGFRNYHNETLIVRLREAGLDDRTIRALAQRLALDSSLREELPEAVEGQGFDVTGTLSEDKEREKEKKGSSVHGFSPGGGGWLGIFVPGEWFTSLIGFLAENLPVVGLIVGGIALFVNWYRKKKVRPRRKF